MAPFTYNYEITVSVPPSRWWKAFIIDDTLICKVLPQIIKSVENLQGDGGPGSIQLVTYGAGMKFKSAKRKVDGVDEKTFTYSNTTFESDALRDFIEKISYVYKLEPSADGGSRCKITITYYPKVDVQLKFDHKALKERTGYMFQAVENYLIANPDAYN